MVCKPAGIAPILKAACPLLRSMIYWKSSDLSNQSFYSTLPRSGFRRDGPWRRGSRARFFRPVVVVHSGGPMAGSGGGRAYFSTAPFPQLRRFYGGEGAEKWIESRHYFFFPSIHPAGGLSDDEPFPTGFSCFSPCERAVRGHDVRFYFSGGTSVYVRCLSGSEHIIQRIGK